MTNPMLAELDEVVRLAEKATPGPWVANDGELATDLYWAGGGVVADALAEFADGLSDPPNAQFVAAAVNFLRTHHATLADMAKRLEAAERDAYMAGYVQGCNDQACVGLNQYELREDAMRAADHAGYAIAATQEGEG